jgi:16S rRNA (guanine527-N7)-methyltransferase
VRELSHDIRLRLEHAGVDATDEAVRLALHYLELLARWNRRINLTAFDLDSPSAEAIDRLIVEPMATAGAIAAHECRVVDIGSGGGSPAVPLTIAAPRIEMTMVEVREKKAAFLREVARTLPLSLRVETALIETLAATVARRFDLVTFRAVRPDKALWRAIDALLLPGGRVLWFGGAGVSIESEVFAEVARLEFAAVVQRR